MLQQHNENKNNNNNSNSNSRSNSNFNSNNNNIKMKAMIANISEYPYLSGGKNTMGVIFQKWDSYLKLASYFFQLLQMLLNFFFQMLLSVNYEYCARASSGLRQRWRHTFTHSSHISLWALSYNSVFVNHLKLMSGYTFQYSSHICIYEFVTHFKGFVTQEIFSSQ